MNNDTSSTPFQPGSPQNPDGAPGAPPLNIKRKDRAFFIDASGIDQPGGKEKLDEAMGIVTGRIAPPEHDASQAALQWASSVLGSEPVRKDLLAELAAKVGIWEEDLEAAAERLGVTRTFVGDEELWAIPDELTSDQRMAAIGVMSERLGRAIDDLKDRRRKDRSGQPTQPASATVGGASWLRRRRNQPPQVGMSSPPN